MTAVTLHWEPIWRTAWWPTALFAVLVLASAALLVLELSRARRAGVIVLRALVLGLLVLLAAGPQTRSVRENESPFHIAIVADASASMDLADVPTGGRRPVRRAEVRNEALKALRSLADAHPNARFSLLPFGRVVGAPRDANDDWSNLDKVPGDGSDLQGALEQAGALRPDLVVVISDGRVTTGLPLNAAERLGVPVHVLPAGLDTTEGSLPDARVVSLEFPSHARVGTSVEVRVRIAAGGAVAGEPVRVQLLAEDKRVEVQTVVPPAADRNRETASDVTFQYTPRRRGPVRLTARVDTGVREVTQANNERTELLRVQDEAMQVLYLEGRLRWDYRALREALGDLPAMRLYTVRGFVPGVDALEASRRLWPGSHVIIAGELPQMNEDQAKALQRLVADGLGLLVVAGPDGFTPDVAGGLWEQVLPAVVERGETARGELRVVPAEAGERILPDLRQVARQVGDVPTAAWDALPPLAARAPVKQLKRNARVLLKTFDGEPLLVTGRFGLGRTAVLLTGDSHRWTRGDAFARAVHRQLILHLVSYLAGRDPVSRHQLRVRLSANRIAAGETVLVEAAYEPAGGAAVGSTNLVAELLPWPDRDGEPPLQRVRLTAGEELWSGEVRALQPGNYDVRVRAVDRASDDTVTQTAEPLLVADSRPEWQRLAADYATLRLLAQRTGGQTLAPDAAEDWTALLAQQIQPRTVRRVERHPLWDQIWLLALLVLALAGEWALRRV